MSVMWSEVPLETVLIPIQRPETPTPGEIYRQLGVKLWGQGAYERESLDGAATKYARLSRVEADDVVVNKIWARNGSVAVVQPSLAGCFVSGEFPTFVTNPDLLIPRWMHWLTKTANFWEQCDEKSRGTSGKNRIRPEQFLKVEIPLPPLAEQRRIVARIEELAAKIAEACSLRYQAIEDVEAFSQVTAESVFQQLRTQHNTTRLRDICESVTDGDHNTPAFSDEGVRFIFVGNVSTGRLHFDHCKRVSQDYFQTLKPQRLPKRGDILYSAVGATLGISAVVDTDEPFCFQRHVAILKPDRRCMNSL
jgi:type I restriction enzyme S subunit